jgi:hypothetical protein
VEEEEGSASSQVWLTDSEGEVEAAEHSQHGQRGQQGEGEEEEEGQPQQGGQQPQWTAGGCRDHSPEPPEDPGSSAAALVVEARGSLEQWQAGVGTPRRSAGGERQARQSAATGLGTAASATSGAAAVEPQQQQPESPAASKARAKAAAAAAPAAAASAAAPSIPPIASFGSMSSEESVGSSKSQPQQGLLKLLPTDSAGSSISGLLAPLEQAGLARMPRFQDPQLERRFAQWLYGQLWRVRAAHARGGLPSLSSSHA